MKYLTNEEAAIIKEALEIGECYLPRGTESERDAVAAALRLIDAPVVQENLLQLVTDADAAFDAMLVGCTEQTFARWQNGDGENVGAQFEAIRFRLKQAAHNANETNELATESATQQARVASPKSELTIEQTKQLSRCLNGGVHMGWITGDEANDLADSIEARSGVNAQLVAALQAIINKYSSGQMVGGCMEIEAARTALAAAGVGLEAK